jgi:AcrR family transcriptional regulator
MSKNNVLVPVLPLMYSALAGAHPLPGEDPRTRQLVEAAYELLDEEGLDGLTIRAVLARSKLARRAFYERFAGKDDLVLAVFRHIIALGVAYYEAIIATKLDPLERLELVVTSLAGANDPALGDAGGSGGRRAAAMSREHLRLAEARPGDLQLAVRPLLALLERLVAEGMAAGMVRQSSPARLATLIYNVVSTTAHAEYLSAEGAPPDAEHRNRLAGELWDFCRRAISADESGGRGSSSPRPPSSARQNL